MGNNEMRRDLLEMLMDRTYGSLRKSLEPANYPHSNYDVDQDFLIKFNEILYRSKSHNIQQYE